MPLRWTIHPDGSYDLHCGGLALRGARPAIDGETVRCAGVRNVLGFGYTDVVYRLIQGGELRLRFAQRAGAVVLGCQLKGLKEAPHWVAPLAHARLEGTRRVFRCALGEGGPSGFVDLQGVGNWESHLHTAVVGAEGESLALGALGHHRFLQKSTVHGRVWQSARGGGAVVKEAFYLEAALWTERVPLAGELDLPDLLVQPGADPGAALGKLARATARAHRVRLRPGPRTLCCVGARKGSLLGRAALDAALAGLGKPEQGDAEVVLIGAGFMPAAGEPLAVGEARWPGGAALAIQAITAGGRKAGVALTPFRVEAGSRLHAEHPDWILRDLAGAPVAAPGSEGRGLQDEPDCILDTSHPGALAWLCDLVGALRGLGVRVFRTDQIGLGLADSTQVRRHRPGRTSVEYLVEALKAIREAMGPEAYWLSCGAPLAPCIGIVDAMRMLGARTSDSLGLAEACVATGQALLVDGVHWSPYAGVLPLAERRGIASEAELRSNALWRGLLGGVVALDLPAEGALTQDRWAFWQFLRPGPRAVCLRQPFWGKARSPLEVLVSDFGGGCHAVLFVNPAGAPAVDVFALRELTGHAEPFVHAWSESGSESLGSHRELVVRLGARESWLVFVSEHRGGPPVGWTLGGPQA